MPEKKPGHWTIPKVKYFIRDDNHDVITVFDDFDSAIAFLRKYFWNHKELHISEELYYEEN